MIMKYNKKWKQAMAKKPGNNPTCSRCPWAFSNNCIDCKYKET